MGFNLPINTLRKIVLFILIFFLIYLLYYVRGILLPFILAIIIAYILNPFVEKLEQYKIKRIFGIIIVYIAVFGFLLVAGYYGLPLIIKQITSLGETIPTYTSQIQQILNSFYRNYKNFSIPVSLRESIDRNLLAIQKTIISHLSSVVSILFNIFSRIISIIVAPILAFYLLKDKEEICQIIVKIIPLSNRSELLQLWEEIDTVLTKFIRGHLTVALIVGASTALGLSIVGMDYPLLLGIITGITNIIPYFGPIIGGIPAVLLALLKSQVLAIYVIIVIVIVQQLESNFISPKVLGSSVGLHPLLVIFVLLAGGEIWGLVGMLVAVPLTAVLKILIVYIFTKVTSN
jgi:sporulation integral membrane protein YtvI